MTEPTTSRWKDIEFMRFLAALLVLFTHIQMFDNSPLNFFTTHQANTYPNRVFLFGGIGVDLFFVISGLVMALTLDAALAKGQSTLGFLLKRALRIYPLYVVATLLYLVSLNNFDISKIEWSHYNLSSLVLMHNLGEAAPPLPPLPIDNYQMPVLFVGWTLVYELFFYSIVAVALFFRKRWLVWGLCALAMFAAWKWFNFFLGSPLILEFLFGFVLYEARKRLTADPKLFDHILLGIALGVFVVMMQGRGWTVGWKYPFMLIDYGPVFGAWWRPAVFGLPAFFLLLALSKYSQFFPEKSLWLGQYSYALYLLHPVALNMVWHITITDFWAFMMLLAPLVVGMIAILHPLVEKPYIALGKKWAAALDRRRARKVA